MPSNIHEIQHEQLNCAKYKWLHELSLHVQKSNRERMVQRGEAAQLSSSRLQSAYNPAREYERKFEVVHWPGDESINQSCKC